MKLPDFSQTRILVVGDVMLDRYWYGDTARISPEAPVPVVNVRQNEERAGGAANVALGLAALGVQASLIGQTGDDEAAECLAALLERGGIDVHLQRTPGHPTITKLRVISHHQQMIRLDFEGDAYDVPGLEADAISDHLQGIQAVVLSDYAKGALKHSASLIEAARAADLPVLVDPKQEDFAVYRGATLLTPNRREFERAVGRCRTEDELVQRGRKLIEEMDWQALLVTRGEEGMTLIQRTGDPVHIPAQAHEVFDVTGAGDTVIAALAAAVAAGESLPQAAALANLAASVAVGKLGTATVSRDELRQAAERGGRQHAHGVVTERHLLDLVRQARARGESVVMTNGCFDILHPGHVAYLEQARALGDRLVVAVNDDDSVRRLKGDGRPVHSVAHRMAVLGGLASVDWVVPFSEDTPARLIEAVAPDVLAKGGDYQVEEIAGHESVLARGGRVEILPFLEDHSTTGTIERIRGGSK